MYTWTTGTNRVLRGMCHVSIDSAGQLACTCKPQAQDVCVPSLEAQHNSSAHSMTLCAVPSLEAVIYSSNVPPAYLAY